MPNRSKTTRLWCRQTPPCPVIVSTVTYQAGYQQALADFAIADLLCRLKTYFDAAWVAIKTQEAEILVTILIQTLTANLDGKLLAAYLDAVRNSTLDTSNALSSLQLPPPATDLPTTFPNVEMPRFLYGDRLCWLSNGEPTDWGVAIGRFYSFAPHRCCWDWCYLIWLDANSPSAAWVQADIAWEDDLETMTAGGVSMNPRPLTDREQHLIDRYSYCQLGMTPQTFYAKWHVSQEAIAAICSRSTSTVRCWFRRGRSYRRPTAIDLRHLALMDFLLEHFEQMPQTS